MRLDVVGVFALERQPTCGPVFDEIVQRQRRQRVRRDDELADEQQHRNGDSEAAKEVGSPRVAGDADGGRHGERSQSYSRDAQRSAAPG